MFVCVFVSRVLLDQLLQYEPVSEDDEEATDYSSSENETVDKKSLKATHTKVRTVWSTTHSRGSACPNSI